MSEDRGRPDVGEDGSGLPEAKELIALLVKNHVAVTSTLPVFEHSVPGRPPLRPDLLDAMTPESRTAFLYARNLRASRPAGNSAEMFQRDMKLEHEFAQAGGFCSPDLIPLAMAARFQASAISARSSCWSKPDSLR